MYWFPTAIMHLVPLQPSSNAAIFEFCETWLGHLSAGDFTSAHGMLAPDNVRKWTPQLIEKLVTETCGSPSNKCAVTAPAEATGNPSRSRLEVDPDDDDCTGEVHPQYPFAVYWFRDGVAANGSVGWVYLGYPLDGEWSDLSSEFRIYQAEEGYVLQLQSIEVM
jgi:hypothetical protein